MAQSDHDHVEDLTHRHDSSSRPPRLDDSNSAPFHIHVENLDRAMQWFRTDTFKDATKRATVVGRDFYLAESNNLALRRSRPR